MIPPTLVSGTFFVAAIVTLTNGDRPGRLDTTTPQNQSWLAVANPLDLANLGSAALFKRMDFTYVAGNWLVRAVGQRAPAASCSLADVASDSSDMTYTPNNAVGAEDLEAFVNAYIADNAALADVASDASDAVRTPNKTVGPEDLEAFVNAFIMGC